jgi:hypothetical protein
MFSQNMLELAMALLDHDATYQEFVLKFVERFFWIAAAVDPVGEHPDEMWDEEDGFFYDVLRLPDGTGTRIKVRSLVGLLPICATTMIEPALIDRRRTHARRHHGLRSPRRDRTTTAFLNTGYTYSLVAGHGRIVAEFFGTGYSRTLACNADFILSLTLCNRVEESGVLRI